MIWLTLAGLGLVAALIAEGRKLSRWPHAAGAALFGSLAIWLCSQYGAAVFGGGEVGLIRGFFVGALLAGVGELFILAGRGRLAFFLIPLAALSYASGLDVLRPDEYSYLPAAIIGLLIVLVSLRAFLALSRSGLANRLGLAAYIAAIAVMLFAALFKLIDRGWTLPWAYLVALGGLLLAASQLWLGWAELVDGERVPAPWQQSAAYLGGQVLLIAAAGFHYLAFL